MRLKGNLMIISILNLFFRSNASTSTLLSDNELEEILKVHSEENLHTTHSEIVKPVHIPVFQKVPVPVPHPVPVAVPQYVYIPIPQPYPKYIAVKHPVRIPVYKIVPEIVEKPVHYIVEKPLPIEIEKPFPVEKLKKLHIPIPKPYPVHVPVYRHIYDNGKPVKDYSGLPKGKFLLGLSYSSGYTPKYKGIYDTKTHTMIENDYLTKQNLMDDNFSNEIHPASVAMDYKYKPSGSTKLLPIQDDFHEPYQKEYEIGFNYKPRIPRKPNSIYDNINDIYEKHNEINYEINHGMKLNEFGSHRPMNPKKLNQAREYYQKKLNELDYNYNISRKPRFNYSGF